MLLDLHIDFSRDRSAGLVFPSLEEFSMIVTHEMNFARAVADRIVFIDGGIIVEETDPETFFEHPSTERAKQFLKTFTFEKKA